MKDTILTGFIAGIIGGLVGVIFSHSLFLMGINPLSSVHLAAALVVNDIFNLTAGGFFWALTTHFVVAAMFGVFMVLVLRYSGKDYWFIKAVGFGFAVCILLHAYLMPLLRPDINFRPNPAAFGTMLITHGLISLVASYFIVKYYKPQVAT